MKTLAFLWLTLALAGQMPAQPTAEKRALIIAIGNYPAGSGWRPIHALNDTLLIRNVLEKQGFRAQAIRVLTDRQATRQGVINAIRQLIEVSGRGDQIVIHISAHGQQIQDQNRDEADQLDEAIACYGAAESATGPNTSYHAEGHLRDDELGRLLDELRLKLGPDGDLLLLADACHAGTITRGGLLPVRGSSRPLRFTASRSLQATNAGLTAQTTLYQHPARSADMAPYVAISATSAGESNSECRFGDLIAGSLSLAVNEAFQHIQPGESYRTLFAGIRSVMKRTVPGQTPQIEGMIDRELFGGKQVVHTGFLTLSSIRQNGKRLLLSAGQLSGVFDSTKVVICRSGTLQPGPGNTLTTGTVVSSNLTTAVVHPDTPLPDPNPEAYRVFVTERTSPDITLRIRLDSSLTVSGRQHIRQELLRNKLVMFTEPADLCIRSAGADGFQLFRQDGTPLDSVIPYGNRKQLSVQIQRFAQSQFLEQLTAPVSQDIRISARLIPLKSGATMPEDTLPDNLPAGSLLTFAGDGTEPAALLIRNTGTIPVYFTVIDIMPNNRMDVLLPCRTDPDCRYDLPVNYFVVPGGSRLVDRVIRFGPPFGKETLIVIAAPEPMDLRDVIDRSRSAGSARGIMHRFKRLLDDTNDMVRLGIGDRSTSAYSMPADEEIALQHIDFQIIPQRRNSR